MWADVEKTVMVTVIGCFPEKTRKRLGTIARMPTMEQLQEIQMHSLQEPLAKRPTQSSQNNLTQTDPERLAFVKSELRYTEIRGKSRLPKQWKEGEKNRVRKLPWAQNGGLAPILTMLSQAV